MNLIIQLCLPGSRAVAGDGDSALLSGTPMTMLVMLSRIGCNLCASSRSANRCKNLFLSVELENMTQRHTGSSLVKVPFLCPFFGYQHTQKTKESNTFPNDSIMMKHFLFFFFFSSWMLKVTPITKNLWTVHGACIVNPNFNIVIGAKMMELIKNAGQNARINFELFKCLRFPS